VAVPGVTVLVLVLAGMLLEAYAVTLGSGGPGTFGRPDEPFLPYITDHLGSVRAVVNQSGVVVETRDYDPFGADISHTGTFSTQHRFTGPPRTRRFRMGVLLKRREENEGAKEPIQRGADHGRAA
jgi:hypothetical protein